MQRKGANIIFGDIMSEDFWDYSGFWTEAIKQLREEISEQVYMMWFNNIAYESSKERNIVLSVPSSFYRDNVKQKYGKLIESKLEELTGNKIALEFVVKKASQEIEEEKRKILSADSPPKPRSQHPQFRKEYTFENFVIAESNSFAANVAIGIAKNPGTAYNPCLIYGGVGLGKTHLIQSIGNYIYREFADAKIVYVTAESFTNEFLLALRDKTTHKFKTKYRNTDVLLIDDIHFLQSHMESTLEELFHTFNALYDTNKQVVLTCDRPILEVRSLPDRLQSRFGKGVNADLKPPSYETRYAILKRKTENIRYTISDEIIHHICGKITTNVRDLESALTNLVAYAEIVSKEPTLEMAQEQLKDRFTIPQQKNVTIDIIKRVVADYFNLSLNELNSKKRPKTISFPRQLAMYIIREITEYSTTEVGQEFGRDHATVMHACRKVENKLKVDSHLQDIVKHLIRVINEKSSRP
jgi:chromosomal replication initiator protein